MALFCCKQRVCDWDDSLGLENSMIENGIKLNSNFRSKINFIKENYYIFAKMQNVFFNSEINNFFLYFALILKNILKYVK